MLSPLVGSSSKRSPPQFGHLLIHSTQPHRSPTENARKLQSSVPEKIRRGLHLPAVLEWKTTTRRRGRLHASSLLVETVERVFTARSHTRWTTLMKVQGICLGMFKSQLTVIVFQLATIQMTSLTMLQEDGVGCPDGEMIGGQLHIPTIIMAAYRLSHMNVCLRVVAEPCSVSVRTQMPRLQRILAH
jgi:hypothetical protein